MWSCPKCHSRVDDTFEVCWSCGTTADGIEDPSFVTADDAEPIPDEELPEGTEVDDPLADFAGTPLPNLVDCYMAANTIEAKFIADRLMEEGIPAIADKIDVNMVMGGLQPTMWGYGPKIRVREDDLPRARAWLKAYEQHLKSRLDDSKQEGS
jgi:Putative prokaryotic signal transducing protein